jgi:hypothetical protein
MYFIFTLILQKKNKKKQYNKPPSKKKKKGKSLSPRNRKACHNTSTGLLQSFAEIGTQCTMKSSRNTLHELSPHIPQKICNSIFIPRDIPILQNTTFLTKNCSDYMSLTSDAGWK